MHGIWCLLGLIMVSGGLGGVIFSLESNDSHKLCIPFKGELKDSGFLGHIFIGIGGAFVAVAGSVPVFDLDLSLYDQVWGEWSTVKLLPSTLYVIGISILGGYSGLRIISGLSNKMLDQLRKEMSEVKSGLEENVMQDQERDKEINELKNSLSDSEKERLLLRGAFLVETSDYADALKILNEYICLYPDEPKPWMWKARAEKRKKDIDAAIKSARKAIELRGDYWLYWYNLACYMSLKDQLNIPKIIEALEYSLGYAKDEELDEFWECLDTDLDFELVRDASEFSEFSSKRPSQEG